jgi:S1-C subfamily serine protease
MRGLLGFGAGFLTLVLVSWGSVWTTANWPARFRPDVCADGADHDKDAAAIEDSILKGTLIREGTALVEGRLTVAAKALAHQLQENPVCRLDLAPSRTDDADVRELPPAANASVVAVAGLHYCRKCARRHASIASGFVIDPAGAIVTNYHVADSPDEETLVVMTAERRVYPVVRVLAASRADDLAILKIEAQGLSALPLAAGPADAPVGSAVAVISHPDGRFFCYTAGVVSRYMRIRSEGRSCDAVAITADYARGSSGAPVLNRRGQVVAVVSSTESIYYDEDESRQHDLQMVVKNCIPVRSLHRLIQPPDQIAVTHPESD